MVDLSERMFYKVRFNVSPRDADSDLLWTIVMHIKNWMVKKHNTPDSRIIPTTNYRWTSFKNGGRIFSEDDPKSVYFESNCYRDDQKLCWACKISERGKVKEGCAPRQWTTQIGLEKNRDEEALFSCVISYSDSVSYIGPCDDAPAPSIPRIIRNMIEDEMLTCSFGNDSISLFPRKLHVGDWYDFWERVTDNERSLPYILISPIYEQNENTAKKHNINPVKLANYLCGNAVVLYYEDQDFFLEMKTCCPHGYECPREGIRVYYPNVDIQDPSDSKRHRYFGLSDIERITSTEGEDSFNNYEEEFLRILRRVFAQDLHYTEDKDFIIIDYCKKLHRQFSTQQRLEKARAEIEKATKEHDTQAAQLFNYWEEEADARGEAEQRCRDLEEELRQCKKERHLAQVQADSYKDTALRVGKMEEALSARVEISCIPKTQKDVVAYFTTFFKDRIAFSEDGMKSVRECTISIDDLWETLHALATTMYDLFQNGDPTPYDSFKRQTAIDCARGEGRMTRRDPSLMKQFLTDFDGETIDIEPHITFPRERQSIHFGVSERDGRIVVGSCGPHKEIYSSRKAK